MREKERKQLVVVGEEKEGRRGCGGWIVKTIGSLIFDVLLFVVMRLLGNL